MEQTEKKRDFKVLAEKISPDNVLIMSELLAILPRILFPQSENFSVIRDMKPSRFVCAPIILRGKLFCNVLCRYKIYTVPIQYQTKTQLIYTNP